MGESERLRLRDVRAIYRLLGECCELGGDPLVWRLHMLQQLSRLLGAHVAICGAVLPATQNSPLELVRESFLDLGWANEGDQHLYQRWLEHTPPHMDPLLVYLGDAVPSQQQSLTCRRRVVLKGDEWYSSAFYAEFYRPSRLDDELQSFVWQARSGTIDGLSIIRSADAGAFDGRQERLLRLFHREACRLLGKKLAHSSDPSIARLPRRQREVLACLLEGDSEKQASLRLGISRHTVHEHVKRLHSYFGASSRGELMSRCRRYLPALQRLSFLGNADSTSAAVCAFGEAFRVR